MHWNGRSWATVDSPNVGINKGDPAYVTSELSALSAAAPDDIWAVGSWGGDYWDSEERTPIFRGRPFALRWDGVEWNVELDVLPDGATIQSDHASLNAVTVTKGEVWALGSYVDKRQSQEVPIILHRKESDCAKPRKSPLPVTPTATEASELIIHATKTIDRSIEPPTFIVPATILVPTAIPTSPRH
jgi:hypothetical protein